jgi:hypothetical protein
MWKTPHCYHLVPVKSAAACSFFGARPTRPIVGGSRKNTTPGLRLVRRIISKTVTSRADDISKIVRILTKILSNRS